MIGRRRRGSGAAAPETPTEEASTEPADGGQQDVEAETAAAVEDPPAQVQPFDQDAAAEAGNGPRADATGEELARTPSADVESPVFAASAGEPADAAAVSVAPSAEASSLRSSVAADRAAASYVDSADGRGVSTFRPLPRVIAVANQKGGVGKTTTTVNLGAALAEIGYRVLVVDLDPQGNATTGLGVDARNFERSMYDVIMHDTPMEDCIEPTSVRGLFVAPATIDLAGVEIELVPAFSRELRLRRAVESVVEDFDFVLIDCPPSLGLITVNGLAAASEVLVPIQCEYYALEGLGQLLRNVHLVASNLNDGLEVSAIVLTMYDARTRLAIDVAAEVRGHFGDKVCRIVIPRTIRLSEAPSFGQPITVFDPSSRGAVAYRELAKEVSNGAAQRIG